MDAELLRARRAYELRGGVEEAARVLAALLRGAGPEAACAWARREVARLDARGRTWLLHDEASRLARVRGAERPPAEERLLERLADLSRAVRGEWPGDRDPHAVALGLEVWRRMLPLVQTERLALGGLFLAAMVDEGVEPVREELEARLARGLRGISRDLGLDRS